MRLRRRVQVLLLGFVALVVIALGTDMWLLSQREHADDHLRLELEPALVELQGLHSSLVEQESAARAYLLTGDERFLEPYDAGRAHVAGSLDRLRDLLRGREALLAAVQRIHSRVTAWQSLGADFEIAAKRDGRDEVVRSLVVGGTGSRLFGEVGAEIAAVRVDLDDEIADGRADVNRIDDVLLVVDFATLALTVGLILLAGLFARWWFTRPLEAFARSVQAVAGGALRSTVSAESPPELADLAADVDAMRRRILAEVEAADRAREALADRGMVVLTLRDELAAVQPVLPRGVEVAGRFAPALGIVAGDWFETVRIDDDRIGVALVDVSGHGAGVGAFALRTKTLTLAALEANEPGEAFSWVAARLGDTGEQFLTGVLLVLDIPSGTVRYASAGHPPMLLAGLAGIVQLGQTGPLLGPIPGTWKTEEIGLDRGDVLVAYSDGLIEARDEVGEPFGIERLAGIVESTQLGGPDAVADACLAAVQQHQVMRDDDLTLCVLSR